ncbi:MAG: hypothetical protein E6G97_21000 [Alphaproteobacteria bacterium]|nr:MAG: hypothetical protein E6G97_21000 [Alphaproteobacteria bacterium]
MPAYAWNTNHRMWKVVAPFADSLAVLKAYITDHSAYVYWSTPRLHDEIAVGDVAYILCTVDHQGIVARGRVAEGPQLLNVRNASAFAHPARLTPPGWDEAIAPSSYKTGIAIEATFWDAPLHRGMRPAQGGVARLSEEEAARIEREIAAR